MLEFIRKRAQTWIAWVIVGFIIIVFASWGIGEYFTSDSDANVAIVNGEKISEREFQMAYYQQQQRMRQMLGDNFDPSMFEQQMRKNVLDGLVEQELLVQVSREEGMRVGDMQLASVIQSFEAFQKDGQFDNEAYNQALQMQGQSPGYFESQMRRGLLAQQLYSGVADSALVTPYAVENMLRLRNQTRDIGYFQIPANRFVDQVEVTAQEIEIFYHDNIAQYMTPEQVRIAYVELSAESLSGQIAIAEQEVEELYQEQRNALADEEERRASHILFEVAADANDEQLEKARANAQQVLDKVKAGESFAELAKAYSADPGSSDFGGDLGFFRRGDMVPEFDAVVFTMAVGEVSDLVKTDFGFHIIRLDEVKEQRIPELAEVHEELLQQLRERQAERLFFEKAEQLANISYEFPDDLTPAADELGLTIVKSQFFTRAGGAGVAANPKVVEVAFSQEVLQEGLNSEPVEIADNHLVVVRVKEHLPEQQRPLVEVEEQIKQQLVDRAAAEKAKQLADAILVSLKDGVATSELAADYDLQWEEVAALGRDDRQLDGAVVQSAFAIKLEGQTPGYNAVALNNGDQAVIRLTAIHNPDPAEFTDQQREAMKRNLLNAAGNAEYGEFVESLKQGAKITVNLSE